MSQRPDPFAAPPGCVECGRIPKPFVEWTDYCALCEGVLCPVCAVHCQEAWDGLCSGCSAEDEEPNAPA